MASGEFLPQAVQHPLKFFDLRQGLIRLLRTEVQVYDDQNLCLQLGQRSFRVRKELYELSRSATVLRRYWTLAAFELPWVFMVFLPLSPPATDHSSLPSVPWHLKPGTSHLAPETYSYLSATIGSTFAAQSPKSKVQSLRSKV